MPIKNFTVRRLVTDAVLVALYVVFAAIFSVKLPFAEISLASIPILICALLFGAADVLAVSVLGSFIEQMLGGYGLTVTTPLWMAPVILQGLFAAALFFFLKKDKIWKIVLAVVLAEILLTVTNTAVLYLDGAIMHYPVKALHLIAPARIINGIGRTAVSAVTLSLLFKPLRNVVCKRKIT